MRGRCSDESKLILQDMSNEDLRLLYKEVDRLDNEGRKFISNYGLRDLDWKNPYIHIQINIKDILGDRALIE